MVKTKKIRIFTSVGCPICKQSIEYLRKQKISFEEINLDDHPELSNIPIAPVICQINKKGKNKCIPGFNPDEIKKLIQGKKVKK